MTITPAKLRESAARQRAAAPDGATVPLADELEAAAAEIERRRLTDAEREAVEWARCMANMHGLENASATLRGLLERLK